ncbi:MAG: hypothetical protein AB7O43_11510 [Hyphomicrobiaceae bacterium]
MQRLRSAERALIALLVVVILYAFSAIPASLLAQAAGTPTDDPPSRAARLAHEAARHFDSIMPQLGLPAPPPQGRRLAQSGHAKPPTGGPSSPQHDVAVAPVWRWLENSGTTYKRAVIDPLTSGTPPQARTSPTSVARAQPAANEPTPASPDAKALQAPGSTRQSAGLLETVRSAIEGWFERANSNYASTIVKPLSETAASAVASSTPPATRTPQETMTSLAETVAKAQREKREADGRRLVELAERTKREREARTAAEAQTAKATPDGESRNNATRQTEQHRGEEAARRVAEAAQAEARRRAAEQAKSDTDRRHKEQAARSAEAERGRAAAAEKRRIEMVRQNEDAARRVAEAAKAEAEKRATEQARRQARLRLQEEAASKAETARRRDAELERQVAEDARRRQQRRIASAKTGEAAKHAPPTQPPVVARVAKPAPRAGSHTPADAGRVASAKPPRPKSVSAASIARSKLISNPIALASAPVITIHAAARGKDVAGPNAKRSRRSTQRRIRHPRHASYTHDRKRRWRRHGQWRQGEPQHTRKYRHHRKYWRHMCDDDD